MWIVSKRLQSFRSVILLQRSVRVAERLALPTSDLGVAGSNPAGGEILPEPKRRFTSQSLSCSPFHRLEMTEILLKGRKNPNSSIHILLQEIWLFNSAMLQKGIHSMNIHSMHCYDKATPQAPMPPITKVTKSINISRIFHLHYSPQRNPVSLNGHGHGPVAELLWVPGVCLVDMTTGIGLTRQFDVIKRRVVTRERSVLVESFVTSGSGSG